MSRLTQKSLIEIFIFLFSPFFLFSISGLNNPQDYFSYAKFVKTPRPTARQLNTGYFTSKQVRQNRIPGYQRKQLINDR